MRVIRQIIYSPKAAKRTRAAKSGAMMEANLAMLTSNTLVFNVYICVKCEGVKCEEISLRSTSIYSREN